MKRLSLVLISLCIWTQSHASGPVESLVKKKERPTVTVLKTLTAVDLIAEYETTDVFKPDEQTKNITMVFKAVIKELKSDFPDHEVYILARDGELLFDAIQASDPELASRTHLVSLSRPAVDAASPKVLAAYMKSHGLDVQKVFKGQSKAIFVDTGYSGTIYRKVLGDFMRLIPKTSPDRKKRLLNILDNVEFRLIASEVPNSNGLESLRKKINSNAKELDIFGEIEALYFPILLQKGRSSINLPDSSYQAWQWVVNNLEHTPKWNNRASTLKSNGTVTLETYETSPVDRKAYLLKQIRIFLEFCGEDCGGPGEIFSKKKKKPQDDVASESLLGKTIKAGTKLVIDGVSYKVIKKVEEGKRGKVFQIESIDDGQIFALKVAKNDDPETVESIQSDAVKAKEYEKLGVDFAQIIYSGSDFVLKEWIEGQRADEWVAAWFEADRPQDDQALLALRKLFEKLAKKSAYIGDLNRKNMIWSGEKWIVIDSGDIRYDLGVAGTRNRYIENINTRWVKDIDGVDTCDDLLLKSKKGAA